MAIRFALSLRDRRAIGSEKLTILRTVYGEALPSATVFEVAVQLVSEEEIRTNNRTNRGVDAVTDVLSFPIYTNPMDMAASPIPELLLGTIIICPEEGERRGTPLIELVHHGLLHLYGYDHETDEKTWNGRESAIIDIANRHGLALRGIGVL